MTNGTMPEAPVAASEADPTFVHHTDTTHSHKHNHHKHGHHYHKHSHDGGDTDHTHNPDHVVHSDHPDHTDIHHDGSTGPADAPAAQ